MEEIYSHRTLKSIRLKVLIPLILSILCYWPAGAQDIVSNDSTEAVRLLNMAQLAIGKSQFKAGITYARQAYNLSHIDSEHRISSLLLLADAYKQWEDYGLSLDYYLQAANLLQESNQSERLQLAYIEIGSLYESFHDHTKAIEYYQKAYDNTQDKQVRGKMLANLAYCYTKTGDYQQAIRHNQELLMYALTDQEATLNILRKQVALYHLTNQEKNALNTNLRILTINKKKTDIRAIAATQNNIGYNYTQLQRYDSALFYFQQTLFLDDQLKQGDDFKANTLLNIGITHQKMGNLKQAIGYLEQALNIREAEKNYDAVANINNIIANLYWGKNDLYNAIVYSEASVIAAEKRNTPDILQQVYHTYSELSRELNDFENALTYAKKYIYITDSLQLATSRKTEIISEKINVLEKQEEAARLRIADEELKALEMKRSELELEKQIKENEVLISEKKLQEAEIQRQELEKEKTLQALTLAEQKYQSERNQSEIANLRKERELQELRGSERQKQIQILENQRDLQQMEIQQQAQKQRNLQLTTSLIGIILVLILAGLIAAWRSNRKLARQKKEIQEKNHELEQKSEEITTQRDAIEQSYTVLEKTHHQLKDTQSKLVAAEKMASLGQLTAGIAHEINNPINFVSSNVRPIKMNIEEVKKIIELLKTIPQSKNPAADLAKIEETIQAADLDYLLEENDALLDGIEEGARRTKEIVAGLRNFSRTDEDKWQTADVNEGILSTLVLLGNAFKNRITIHKDLGKLPAIECQPGKLNQVFMNLLKNAGEAIPGTGEIFIKTQGCKDDIQVSIRDTGSGMSEDVKNKIFEPFFTTKEVGKGTGLGLAISYGIVEKHNGKIIVNSKPGYGTEFIISLPKVQSVVTPADKNKEITI